MTLHYSHHSPDLICLAVWIHDGGTEGTKVFQLVSEKGNLYIAKKSAKKCQVYMPLFHNEEKKN